MVSVRSCCSVLDASAAVHYADVCMVSVYLGLY